MAEGHLDVDRLEQRDEDDHARDEQRSDDDVLVLRRDQVGGQRRLEAAEHGSGEKSLT